MSILDYVLGRRLATSEEGGQRVGPAAAIPMLGLDALSSAAYGPEAALTVLLPAGAVGASLSLPITLAILALLFIVYLSYLQTIQAYPSGGGSYTVAKQNLGKVWGLLGAAALMLDYILTVAVGISAGVGALISAVPELQPHTLSLCLAILTLITVTNLRGVKESGTIFMVPTYAFLGSLGICLAIGVVKAVTTGGHPIAVAPLPIYPAATGGVTLWLLLRAFSSGCTAMTGVEAVSNGVTAFREPVVKNARVTLSMIIAMLIVLLLGIAYLTRAYGINATDPGLPGYDSVISQLVAAVVGRGLFYYLTIGSVIAVLALSANTGFADFPRMCQIIAKDGYLPSAFAQRGRRLVFSHGIIFIAVLAALLLIVFGGVTDRLIPLYAIGAFMAFTLSQAGMVMHWWRERGPRHLLPMGINALGALATGAPTVVVLVSKFTEGAWISMMIIPILLFTFRRVRRHYVRVARQIVSREPLTFSKEGPPVVLVPMSGWNRTAKKALQFAVSLSPDVYGVHVRNEEHSNDPEIEDSWRRFVTEPAEAAQRPAPKLVVLPCPYRTMFGSFVHFVDKLEAEQPQRRIAVVIPNLVEFRWYHFLLHNQRGMLLSAALTVRKDPRIVIMTVPWYLTS